MSFNLVFRYPPFSTFAISVRSFHLSLFLLHLTLGCISSFSFRPFLGLQVRALPAPVGSGCCVGSPTVTSGGCGQGLQELHIIDGVLMSARRRPPGNDAACCLRNRYLRRLHPLFVWGSIAFAVLDPVETHFLSAHLAMARSARFSLRPGSFLMKKILPSFYSRS